MAKEVKIILILLFSLVSCSSKPDPEVHYIDCDLKIVKINNDESLSDDKFHTPRVCNLVLLETLKGDKRYTEMNSCDGYGITRDILTPEWMYNHKEGDTIHFDYILKSRFFKIKDRR